MKPLSPRQRDVLRFIIEHVQREWAPPTYREVMRHFSWASTRAAQDHVEALVRKGYLTKVSGRSRGLKPTAEFLARIEEAVGV